MQTTERSAVPNVKLLIGGELIDSTSSQWRDIINPATQQVLARVPFATQAEVDAAISAAAEAFKTWRKTPIGARARIFLKYQQLIREHMHELAALLTAEQGKTLADAEGDVFRGLEVVEHAAGIGNLQLGELANNVAGGVDTYTLLQPLGVCAGITPFNFPAMIPLWMFPMAIATGNTFVLKPSEQDPMVTMRLVELAMQAGVPPGVLNVVHGGAEVVNRLCDHPEIKAVSFVGSTQVGTHVYNRATQNGKRAQCMMGAKNHAIVMPDANRQQTLNNLVGAAFGAAGQRCMALSTVILVGEAQTWLPELVERSKTLRLNAGTEAGADLGPVVSCAALERIHGLIAAGVAEGATLALDGRNPTVPGFERGNFIAPTLFSDVTPTMRIYREEIFGPVLCVLNAASLDEAIALINANPNGNGTAI
ncbi:MAG: CoA-acylating methylmalonate-semialdehyde dehydrogenase, partial [Pseudomonas sp.]|uniref:CoA-acylating methylmalonate-semialdehyde dehydrogenase n=1 Tax=Pseudomonas sp. TaxID=306 RepID=UPI0030F035D4